MSTEPRKLRFLVLVDEDRVGALERAFEGQRWARVVALDEKEYPLPAGQRLVSDAAWEVLRQGARISIDQIREGLTLMGTRHLAERHRTPNERWSLAELARRAHERETFED